jgi:hypothetical protein
VSNLAITTAFGNLTGLVSSGGYFYLPVIAQRQLFTKAVTIGRANLFQNILMKK